MAVEQAARTDKARRHAVCGSSWAFIPKRKHRAGYTLAASASQAGLRAMLRSSARR